MNVIPSIVAYAGLLIVLVGGLSILRPLRFLGIWSRVQGVMLLVGGAVVFLIGARWPAGETRVATPATYLDGFVPAYQFSEFHSIRIQASRERVSAAIRDVTPQEVSLYRTLTWIRRGGQSDKESMLNPAANKALLDVALRTGFLKLAEEPDREIVLGTLVGAPPGTRLKADPTPEDFKALQTPGFALAAINFRLEDGANGETLLTTETRVHATDDSARKKFGAYWRVIYPGSAIIRVMWLRAIKQRAEMK